MSAGLVGLYGVYLVLVGIHHHSSELLTLVEDNGREFLVWILAIVILRAIYQIKSIRPAIKPFVALVVIVFVIKNWNTIKGQLETILPANVLNSAVKPAATGS